MSGIRLPELNVILLNGRLTRDPEIFFTSGGIAKCSFNIAVNKRVKDSKTNEWKDETFFMPIVVWREQAERCKEKLKKGSPVSVEGKLRGREYEDKSGAKRSVLEVQAVKVQILTQATGGDAPAAAKEGDSEEAAAAGSENLEEVPF